MKLPYKLFFALITLISVISSTGLCSSVSALETADIFTTFSSEYIIDSENTAVVNLTVKLTNQDEDPTILTSYDLNIGSVLLSDLVVAHDDQILVSELHENQGLVIRILFGDITLRPDQEYIVDVQYKIVNFMSGVGGAYDFMIPVFASGTNVCTDFIKIRYDNSYGSVNYSITDYVIEEHEEDTTLLFTNFLKFDHLYVSIGNQKSYSFNLEKTLKNEQETYVKTEYVLPPNLDTQSIVINSISPYPDFVHESEEGNYILSYDIAPDQEIWLRVNGYLTVNKPEGLQYYLSATQRSYMTDTDSEWWSIDDDDLLSEITLIGSELSVERKVDWIYNYVMETLNLSENFRDLHGFDYRKGADVALKTYKNASAEDFADSFVGLARNMDIPSRLVAGYVFPYTMTGDCLGMFHVWPQYWTDIRGWVSVDPAYQVYTEYPHREQVGLNRIIAAVVSDSVDSFGFDDTSTDFFLTGEIVERESGIDAEIVVRDKVDSGTIFEGNVLVRNVGNTILNDLTFSSEGSEFDVDINDSCGRNVILPGESVEIDFDASIYDWCESGEKLLTFAVTAESLDGVHNVNVEKRVSVSSVWWSEPVSWLVTILLFVMVTAGLYLCVWFLIKLIIGFKKILKKIKVINQNT